MMWDSGGMKLKNRLGEKRTILKFYWFPTQFTTKWVWLESFPTNQEIQDVLSLRGVYKYK